LSDNSTMTMTRKKSILLAGISCLCFFFSLGYRSALQADSDLTVTRDKDKTVYTIGPDKAGRGEEERKEEEAWDMLRNTEIRPRERRDGPRQHEPGPRSVK
jgi:hypothetical protein